MITIYYVIQTCDDDYDVLGDAQPRYSIICAREWHVIRLLSFIVECLVDFDLQRIRHTIHLKVLTIPSLVNNVTHMNLVHRVCIVWIRYLKQEEKMFRNLSKCNETYLAFLCRFWLLRIINSLSRRSSSLISVFCLVLKQRKSFLNYFFRILSSILFTGH